MKNSEVIEMTTEDLKEKVAAEKAALNKMTMNHTITPLENTMQIRAKRKDIARMMTELRKRKTPDLRKIRKQDQEVHRSRRKERM